MAERTTSSALLFRLPLAAIGVAAMALGAGCVTRTVYVVDDRDEPPMAAAPQAMAQTMPPRGADVSGPEEFYEPLAQHGRWHQHPRYGYVFAPHASVVGAGWRPYSQGHWEYTEWGWTWVSDLPFGWATFHYGRWFYDSGYGWVWVPGNQWAPAWVTWRTGGGYVGWSPMPPGAVYGASYSVYDSSWIFVSTSNFGAPYIYPVIVTGGYYRNCLVVTRPYRSTYVVYGSTYYRGPDPDGVRREGGRVVHRPISDVDNDRPTSRPPDGVRVGSASHNGHDGSVGATRNGRSGDGSSRPRDGDDDTRGSRDGSRDDRASDRGGDRGQGERGQSGSDRGAGRGRDSGLPLPGGSDSRDDRGQLGSDRGGQGLGPSFGPGGADRGDGRGQARERDDDDDDDDGRSPRRGRGDSRVPPGARPPSSDSSQPPGSVGNGLVVTPPAAPAPSPAPGNGGPRGGDDDGDGSDEGGVRANNDVLRPDSGEVRSPGDNPYGRQPSSAPGGVGSGAGANSFGAQSAPAAGQPARAQSAQTDSRFGRPLPSRFGAPASAAPRVQQPRHPAAGTPAPGYGRPTTEPSNPYGPVTAPRSAPAQQRYTAPAPAPAARQAPPPREQPRQQKKKAEKKKDDDKKKAAARKQSRRRR